MSPGAGGFCGIHGDDWCDSVGGRFHGDSDAEEDETDETETAVLPLVVLPDKLFLIKC